MPAEFGTGIAYALGATLLAAGLLKAADPSGTRMSLDRLSGRGRGEDRRAPLGSRTLAQAAAVLISAELAVGAALLAAPRAAAVDAITFAVFAAFPWVVRRARRLGTACGCFGSFSTHTSGPKEAARAAALATSAAAMTVLIHAAPAGPHSRFATYAGALTCAGGTSLATALAPPRGMRRPRRRAAAGRDAAAWRRATLRRRLRVLRTARTDPDVAEVILKAAIDPACLRWRTAAVAESGRPTRITQAVVHGDACVLHVVVPAHGRTAVVLFTPRGPFVPTTRA